MSDEPNIPSYAQEGCDGQHRIREVAKLLYRRCRWCECLFMPQQYYFNGYCERCDEIRRKVEADEEVHEQLRQASHDESSNIE